MGDIMIAHQVVNGVIVNTIVIDSIDDLPGLISAEDGGTIGDLYDNGNIIKHIPVPIVEPPDKLAELEARIVAIEKKLK